MSTVTTTLNPEPARSLALTLTPLEATIVDTRLHATDNFVSTGNLKIK